MSEDPQIRCLRRRYGRQGVQVRSIPERSRWHAQYGPYMLVDAGTNAVIAYGLDLDSLTRQSAA